MSRSGKRILRVLLGLLCIVWQSGCAACPSWWSGCESRGGEEPPNIVFITIDTLRADRLGAYGYFRDTSPVLDALASESILFERCIAPMATTFPSHLSLFTGNLQIASLRFVAGNLEVSPLPLSTERETGPTEFERRFPWRTSVQ